MKNNLEDGLSHLLLTEIQPDPNQPRKDFDQQKLDELSNSIKVLGVITPILIRLNPNYRDDSSGETPPYIIIAGERRWIASKMAGKSTIPAIIKTKTEDVTKDARYSHQLTENLHRENLNPVELAEFIGERIDYLKTLGHANPTARAAEELGVSPSWVSKRLAILKYAPEIRAVARDGHIRDYTSLKKIAKLPGEQREKALELIKSGQFNSKVFFKKKPRGNSVTNSRQTTMHNKTSYINSRVSVEQWVAIISLSDFKFVLDRKNPAWMSAPETVVKGYVKSFLSWLNETKIVQLQDKKQVQEATTQSMQ